MDYLRRDATFVGVSYGLFDNMWLTSNMTAYACDEGWMLGLGRRAIWALENFLLARYPMFLAVYHHHTAVPFDTMLGGLVSRDGLYLAGEPRGLRGLRRHDPVAGPAGVALALGARSHRAAAAVSFAGGTPVGQGREGAIGDGDGDCDDGGANVPGGARWDGVGKAGGGSASSRRRPSG